jgi:quinol monooxygenase YgiN
MEQHAFRIRAFEGCEYLQILQDKDDPLTVFTYSHWTDEEALEHYRNSDLFRELWPQARNKFAEKPQAWTVDRVIERP